jgi:hypothetical protein
MSGGCKQPRQAEHDHTAPLQHYLSTLTVGPGVEGGREADPGMLLTGAPRGAVYTALQWRASTLASSPTLPLLFPWLFPHCMRRAMVPCSHRTISSAFTYCVFSDTMSEQPGVGHVAARHTGAIWIRF